MGYNWNCQYMTGVLLFTKCKATSRDFLLRNFIGMRRFCSVKIFNLFMEPVLLCSRKYSFSAGKSPFDCNYFWHFYYSVRRIIFLNNDGYILLINNTRSILSSKFGNNNIIIIKTNNRFCICTVQRFPQHIKTPSFSCP
jgi:hypothetical protein